MSGLTASKSSMLLILKELYEMTDENHVMNARNLSESLEKRGLYVNRKTIYNNIEILRRHNIDIVCRGGRTAGYFIGTRLFDEVELRLLVELVGSADLFTEEKSRELIDKIGMLTDRYSRMRIMQYSKSRVRRRNDNEEIYESAQCIHEAIRRKKKISFAYRRPEIQGELGTQTGDELFLVSPLKAYWNGGEYCLLAVSEDCPVFFNPRSYRVSRMKSVRLAEDFGESFSSPTLAEDGFAYGESGVRSIRLLADAACAEDIAERYGFSVVIVRESGGQISAVVRDNPGRSFYLWIAERGGLIRIVWPSDIMMDFDGFIRALLLRYKP